MRFLFEIASKMQTFSTKIPEWLLKSGNVLSVSVDLAELKWKIYSFHNTFSATVPINTLLKFLFPYLDTKQRFSIVGHTFFCWWFTCQTCYIFYSIMVGTCLNDTHKNE